MNASLRTFPSAPWVFHESHAETSQSTTVKASPREIWKQEVQMHGHETAMKEPVLQGCCFLRWQSKSWKATPLPAPLWTWHQGLTRCQYGLFESQLQKAARQEKKKKKGQWSTTMVLQTKRRNFHYCIWAGSGVHWKPGEWPCPEGGGHWYESSWRPAISSVSQGSILAQ